MILLDTNVLLAMMRLDNEPAVEVWLDRQDLSELHASTVTIFETRLGLERLHTGRRRRTLERSLDRLLVEFFTDRIINLDVEAARAAAAISASGYHSGRVIEIGDALIAGVAVSRGAALATGNTEQFVGRGLTLVDPWNR